MPDDVNSVLPEAGPGAGFSPAATPQDFGSGVGAALGEAGEVATRLHHDAQAQARQTMAIDGSNQMDTWLNANVYHPTDGVLNKSLGKDAGHAVDSTLSGYDEQVSKIAAGMPDDMARESFLRSSQAQRQSLTRELYRYEDTQFKTYAGEVDKASIGNSVTAAVRAANDPDEVQFQIAKQQAVLAQAARRNGTPPEMLHLQQTEAASSTHMAVLGQLTATGKDQAAAAYYAANKDALTAKDSDRAATMVKEGSAQGDAQRISDRLLAGDGGAPVDRLTFLDRVQKENIQDPRVRELVLSRGDEAISRHQQAVREDQQGAFDQALALAAKSPQGLNDPALVPLHARMGEDRWMGLQGALRKDTPPDPALGWQMRKTIASLPAAQRADFDFRPYYGRVSQGDIAEGQRMALEAMKPSTPVADGILSREQVAKGTLISAGYDAEKNPQGYNQAMADVDDRVRAWETANGKKADGDRVRQLTDQMLLDQVRVGGKVVRAAEVAPEAREGATLAKDDLKAYAQRDQAGAIQLQANLKAQAASLGRNPDDIIDDQWQRAAAQIFLGRDADARGDRAGSAAAMMRMRQILSEQHKSSSWWSSLFPYSR